MGPNALMTYDITTPAAGEADVMIRFVYTANWGWYWKIDDVIITGW